MNDALLPGRKALVTGSAKRTGRAIALALAKAGADVAVHHRTSDEEAERTAADIRALGRSACVVAGDLIDASTAEAVVQGARSGLGGLDILVNNVGMIRWKRLDELSAEDWQAGIDGTLRVTLNVCRAALPALRAQRYGRIVNILDADADLVAPVDLAAPYKIGKTGTWMLTKSLAVQEAPHGITVNAVSPGTLDNSEQQPPLSQVPAGRAGRVDEVADAVLFFVREQAGYVTGSNLKVSGGYLI